MDVPEGPGRRAGVLTPLQIVAVLAVVLGIFILLGTVIDPATCEVACD
ncbi:MAG: hypothetical protein AAF547_11415 [Actinomycetota bacterium]